MALLALTLALLAMTVATTAITVPLDMALDSFDDQYKGCGPAMKAELPALNHSEFQKNPLFAKAWSKAVSEWQRRRPPETSLSSDQAIAIMAYLLNGLYQQFNEAVRVAGNSPQEYRDNFHFKTLHFLLTDALATLRAAQGQRCCRVSWGVCGVRFEARLGDTVRFGQFVPRLPSETHPTCTEPHTIFNVSTCLGVELPEFLQSLELMEVLIPPFETFEVIKVTQKGGETTIVLHPTKVYTKYNCEWLKGGSVPRAPGHLGGLLLATTALAVATAIL